MEAQHSFNLPDPSFYGGKADPMRSISNHPEREKLWLWLQAKQPQTAKLLQTPGVKALRQRFGAEVHLPLDIVDGFERDAGQPANQATAAP